MKAPSTCGRYVLCCLTFIAIAIASFSQTAALIGKEVAIPEHLQDGQEYKVSLGKLVEYGERLFLAQWTIQEGAGRPNAKGNANGSPLSDPGHPLVFPRNFNRISGPDSNSCSGCHNEPFVGGGGDRATEVFVLGQRFDFATLDHNNLISTAGAVDELGDFVTLETIANERKTIGMNGSGFIEMLAREMTSDLQAIRNSTRPGQAKLLVSKGVSFGTLSRDISGNWNTSRIEGLPAQSLQTSDPNSPPSLLIMPFQQAGSVVSLRQFTNNAFMQHFGIQPEERIGSGNDEDGDGHVNELTRADITAATIYQATLPVPGQVLSRDPAIRQAVRDGERQFKQIGCASCHIPMLPLTDRGWIYTEPNPYNPAGNLRPEDAPPVFVDLTSNEFPGPHLKPDANGIVWVPAFTDLKLHDITSGPNDPNAEPLDQNLTPGTKAFFSGNRRFLTRKLWGVGNSGPYMHHGKFTTMREAILAHSGEALSSRMGFENLSDYDRDCIIEFLKSLRILPPGTESVIEDEQTRSPLH